MRFGIRAKSIKNKARINAELSPSELKNLLKKAQRDVEKYQAYIGLVEQELASWRAGGQVDKAQWASMEKALGLQPGEAAALANKAGSPKLNGTDDASPGSNTTSAGRATPRTPALDSLRNADSRPDTPTSAATDKDEREEFLRRENELMDQLSERESTAFAQEKQLKELQEEIAQLRQREAEASSETKAMSAELGDLRLQAERLTYESKEAAILAESTKEQNHDLALELEELRKSLAEAKSLQKSNVDADKERKKAEKLALLMGNFDSGIASEKEEEIRSTLLKLDQAVELQTVLTPSDISLFKSQLLSAQMMARQQSEKSKQTMEEYQALARRREEMESRILSLEQECEELLDKGGAESDPDFRAKVEAEHSARRDTTQRELVEAKLQLDRKAQEIRELQISTEALKNANEELRVRVHAWWNEASLHADDVYHSALSPSQQLLAKVPKTSRSLPKRWREPAKSWRPS